jgi:Raf kinase inhibitor-like YbhB/YbcL family protein
VGPPDLEETMALSIRSPAFDENAEIPDKYSKDGRNLSPELIWSGVPEGTRSFALVVEDPDAPSGMFRHWAVYDIPGDQTGLKEGEDVSAYGVGVNDFGNARYDGPQPPRGHGVHHYHFRLAALDTDHVRGLSNDASAANVRDKIQRHLIEEAETVGTYESAMASIG